MGVLEKNLRNLMEDHKNSFNLEVKYNVVGPFIYGTNFEILLFDSKKFIILTLLVHQNDIIDSKLK